MTSGELSPRARADARQSAAFQLARAVAGVLGDGRRINLDPEVTGTPETTINLGQLAGALDATLAAVERSRRSGAADPDFSAAVISFAEVLIPPDQGVYPPLHQSSEGVA